ncbi:MAG TPA: response regulator [Pyrinomonadaceae bacterium]|jgi:signal transduction histidine kinase
MSIVFFETLNEAAPTPPPLALDGEDSRILVVDDEECIRTLFKAYLSERYTCFAAANSEEALTLLCEQPFALVISDMIMPGLSGVELLREITSRYPDTAVIMVSGIDRPQRVLDAMRLGAYDYLVKPCDLDVLEMCVERALERRALLRKAHYYKQDLERHNEELTRSKAELERLQLQIVQSEKMASLGQLAAGVAHELNNPAGFIFGNMELLQECEQGLQRLLDFYERAPLPAEACTQAERIKKEIDYENTMADLHSILADCREGAVRIRDVVQNLRTFSRLDEAEFKKVDIHEGIESTIRLLSHYYSADHITLERDYAELPQVDCYAGQLNQVWMNLLVNAAHAVKDGGIVSVKTEVDGQSVVVIIKDSGCGIPAEYLKKIFDPFFTTKPVGEGTGLGLSVTYSIIERHKGSISVESLAGQGTAFRVEIPVDAAHYDRKEEA